MKCASRWRHATFRRPTCLGNACPSDVCIDVSAIVPASPGRAVQGDGCALPRAPDRSISALWAGPDRPARTRSAVHQFSPVIRARRGQWRARSLACPVGACPAGACPAGAFGGLVVWPVPCPLIAVPPVRLGRVRARWRTPPPRCQTLSDIQKAVASPLRAVCAVARAPFADPGSSREGLIDPGENPGGLGGSAASLPVRGFMRSLRSLPAAGSNRRSMACSLRSAGDQVSIEGRCRFSNCRARSHFAASVPAAPPPWFPRPSSGCRPRPAAYRMRCAA